VFRRGRAYITAEAPQPDGEPSGWGELVGSDVDCEPGYLAATWGLFGDIYGEAGVIESATSAEEGIDPSIIEWLVGEGYDTTYASNAWVGRLPL